MTGVTQSGFAYDVDERCFLDLHFAKSVATIQRGDPMEKVDAIWDMLRLMLGEDGFEALMKHVAKKNGGFAVADAVLLEVNEILTAYNETKNSSSSHTV